jgi:hypothetical protein
MAGPAPTTRNWRALENAHKPKGLHVLVFGEVEVSATNKQPVLTEAAERNPKNLGLHLTIEESGEGAQVVVWKGVRFHREVEADEFDHVVVRWNVGQIANFPIHDDREHTANTAAAMKALNQQHADKGKASKPAGKKPAKKAKKMAAASKKSAPKKKSAAKKKPRNVGGWAGRKAKKKTKKKAPKKTARRAAQKSAKKKRR